jgi:ssDNA-binding replication factor A large subunit
MLVDLSKSEQEVLDSIRNTEKYKSGEFRKKYLQFSSELRGIIEASKIYILDNYKKIDDYSELSLILRCVNHDGTKYFGKKGIKRRKKKNGENTILSDLLAEMERERIEISNFDSAVYDWSDGDFSVVFNGVPYNWIDGESIIDIASYIENNIKKIK